MPLKYCSFIAWKPPPDPPLEELQGPSGLWRIVDLIAANVGKSEVETDQTGFERLLFGDEHRFLFLETRLSITVRDS